MTNGIVEWLSENGAYEYYFGKLQLNIFSLNLGRIVFMALGAMEIMRFL